MTRALAAALGLVTASLAGAAELDHAADCVITPRSTIELGSHEDGILSEVLVQRGDVVEKGALIAKLEDDVERLTVRLARVRAESDVAVRSADAQARYRDKAVGRLDAPLADNTVAQSVYDQAEIEYQLASLSLEAAVMEHEMAQVELQRAEAGLARRVMRSPIDGVVVDVAMSVGEYVHEQTPVMTLAEVDPLNVEVFLPVAWYGSVVKGMKAEIRPEEPIGGTHMADVAVVDSVFDAASRTFGVRLELANPDHQLPAGLRCTVTFLNSEESVRAESAGIVNRDHSAGTVIPPP